MGTGVNKGWMGMNEDHETHHQISMLLNEVLIMQYISTFGNFRTNYIICTNVEILNNYLFIFPKNFFLWRKLKNILEYSTI
jgi:hypothetical protein